MSRLFLRATASVLAIGMAGCSAREPKATETVVESAASLTTANQICADWSPYNPSENWHCENTQDVGHVYQAARQLAGAQVNTITLWVLWPIDEGQEADSAKINGWFDQASRVLGWLKAQPDLDLFDRSVRSLTNGRNRLVASQQRLINQKKGAIAGDIQAVKNKVAAQANDPEKAALANTLAGTKIELAEMHDGLDRANADLVALRHDYQVLLADFKTFKDTEPAVMDRLAGFAHDASVAEGAALAQVQVAMTDYQQQQTTAPGDFLVRATQMRAQLVAIQEQYEGAQEPHRNFMAERGLSSTNLVDTPLRVLGNMMGYCQLRQASTDAAFHKLLDGVRARSEALLELQVDKDTHDTLTNARFLTASTAFLDQSNARIAQLWAAPPTSPTLKYPFYSTQYDAFTAFQQLEAMCSQAQLAASPWMTAGCNVMQPSFDRARSWVHDTLPGALTLRLVLLRRKGADEGLCKQVEAQLAAGNLKAATVAYDAALHLLDPEVSP